MPLLLFVLPPLPPPLWLGSDEARAIAAVAATAAAADDAMPELSSVNDRWYREPKPVLPDNVIDESMPLCARGDVDINGVTGVLLPVDTADDETPLPGAYGPLSPSIALATFPPLLPPPAP